MRRMCDQAGGSWPLSVVLTDTGGVRQVLCPVLVGRGEEVRYLEAALAAAGAGRGGVVLVTGEAGVGKSRLVREAARAAEARGLVVLAGRAVASDVPTPFRPFAEALASAGRAGRLPAGPELDPFRPALGRLVPEWRQPRQRVGDESLVFLGEAVLRLLRTLSGEVGCLLVLEDLHWADRETLALLEYLADNSAAERVLCVGTLRDEEGAAAARLAGVLDARGSAVVLLLGRLDAAAADRMALACCCTTLIPVPGKAPGSVLPKLSVACPHPARCLWRHGRNPPRLRLVTPPRSGGGRL